MRALDLDTCVSLRAGRRPASFTRAAEASGATQSAVSLKLKKLEQRLGRRLIERTPRLVRLSGDGARSSIARRALLAAHDRAVSGDAAHRRLSLGISEHAAGPELAQLIARRECLRSHRCGSTFASAFARHARCMFDAASSTPSWCAARPDGATARNCCRTASAGLRRRPFVNARRAVAARHLAKPCGVHALASRALDAAKIKWIKPSSAAASRRSRPPSPRARRRAACGTARAAGSIDIGTSRGTAEASKSDVMLHSRVSDPAFPGGAHAGGGVQGRRAVGPAPAARGVIGEPTDVAYLVICSDVRVPVTGSLALF